MGRFEAFLHLVIVVLLLYFCNVLIKNPNAYNDGKNITIICFSLLYSVYCFKSRKNG